VNYPWMRKKGRSGKDSVGWDPALYEWRTIRIGEIDEECLCRVPIKEPKPFRPPDVPEGWMCFEGTWYDNTMWELCDDGTNLRWIKPKVVKADIYSGRHWVTTGNMPKRVMCTTTSWHSYSAVGDRLQRDVTFDDCRGLVEYLNGCGNWKAWL
jgi:hypothetical protein